MWNLTDNKVKMERKHMHIFTEVIGQFHPTLLKKASDTHKASEREQQPHKD